MMEIFPEDKLGMSQSRKCHGHDAKYGNGDMLHYNATSCLH